MLWQSGYEAAQVLRRQQSAQRACAQCQVRRCYTECAARRWREVVQAVLRGALVR